MTAFETKAAAAKPATSSISSTEAFPQGKTEGEGEAAADASSQEETAAEYTDAAAAEEPAARTAEGTTDPEKGEEPEAARSSEDRQALQPEAALDRRAVPLETEAVRGKERARQRHRHRPVVLSRTCRQAG